jgi:hypothetical protein
MGDGRWEMETDGTFGPSSISHLPASPKALSFRLPSLDPSWLLRVPESSNFPAASRNRAALLTKCGESRRSAGWQPALRLALVTVGYHRLPWLTDELLMSYRRVTGGC